MQTASMGLTEERHTSSHQEPPMEKLDRNTCIPHFSNPSRQTAVILHDSPFLTQIGREASFSSHRIRSKSQQNQHKFPGALLQPLQKPRGSQSSKLHLTTADYIPIGSSHSRPPSTKMMSAWAIWLALLCLLCLIFFLLSPLSGLLAKSLTITESDRSSKLRKLN